MGSKRKLDLKSNEYVDRDISWMYFNHRILKEASKVKLPLYDRLMFLGIYSSNLDEFYKVRVASLQRIAESKAGGIKDERKDAKRQISIIKDLTEEYNNEYVEVEKEVFASLLKRGIALVNESELTPKQRDYVHDYFMRHVSDYINPTIITDRADLSSVNDAHIYLAVKMEADDKKPAYAILALPVALCGRFIKIPDRDDKTSCVMYLDDIVRMHLPHIFIGSGYTRFSAYALKFSKDAEMEVESDPEEGILRSITQAVKDRRKGMPVRVIFGEGIPSDLKSILNRRLHVDKLDLVSVGGRYHNHRDLSKFPYIDKPGAPLRSKPWPTVEISEVDSGTSLIERIRKKDLLIHVPYDSFDTFVKFLQECAIAPQVKEIKATIYRAANESQVVKALAAAAKNGKKVTAMVELMARFDESSNILISQTLREAGVEVLPSTEGFKVHGKVVWVNIKGGKNIAVVSTGNFHEGNAKTYTDCLLFTANRKIVKEVGQIFNFIAEPYRKQTFHYLLVSPNHMQSVFQRLIRNEEKNALAGKPAGIKIKINHITDKPMVALLYEAAANNVPIDLLIRGNNSLVTTLPKLKGNIRIKAIIDRYLEHSRIFIFQNGGHPLYFMGSADWMPRNLYNRIEVVTPVFDPDCQKKLEAIVDAGLADNCQASIVNGGPDYLPVPRKPKEKIIRSQEVLTQLALADKTRSN